ncbi:MAG: AMIN domain-containing protein [Gammaproteobacteria bacterium]|nr:AMIN domain-containing protein [Gammaproteobacteria bacterium]
MRKLAALQILLISALCSLPLWAQSIRIDNLRIWAPPDSVRLVFDTSEKVSHRLFSLKNPHRLVIDIDRARLEGSLPNVSRNNPMIKRIRSASRKGGDLRVVLDLKQSVKPKSFVLNPNRQYGHRLVVDLFDETKSAQRKPQKTLKAVNKGRLRDVVIAIDAGHGGEDPGARGKQGNYEKTVVLAISRKLADLVAKEPGMKPVMIRKGDYYLGLRKRMELARQHRADLFISIHADAFRDSRVRGSSVYTISPRGASSEAARWLAERENSADLVGGVTLEDKDDMLASVLLDLSQSGTLQASHKTAEKILSKLKKVGKTHKSRVQQAGFMVLKSPDIPSVLVETAFISNPAEERNLTNPRHQRKLAKALMQGIREYFKNNAPPGTLLADRAPRRHITRQGDTLGRIARRYQVTLASLRTANQLSGDRIRIGQVLRIPET